MTKRSSYSKSGFIPDFGLCLDWETSGSDFSGDSTVNYQGICLAASVYNTDTFDIVDSIKIYIKFDETKYKWTDASEKIHGITREYLEEHGLSKEDAAVEFVNFILKYFGPSPKIMVLGHNVEFDIKFTRQLLEEFGLMFAIHHVHLDTSGAGLIAFNKFKSDDLFELIGLPPRGSHDPLEDVKYTLELAKSIRLLVQSALGE